MSNVPHQLWPWQAEEAARLASPLWVALRWFELRARSFSTLGVWMDWDERGVATCRPVSDVVDACGIDLVLDTNGAWLRLLDQEDTARRAAYCRGDSVAPPLRQADFDPHRGRGGDLAYASMDDAWWRATRLAERPALTRAPGPGRVVSR